MITYVKAVSETYQEYQKIYSYCL